MERLKLSLTQAEFDDLKTLMRMKRWDWPAVFSTNNRREIWPFVTNGYTPEENRKQVRGESRVIDEVADFYLKVRNDCGRFFIDDLGAYYKNADIGEGLNLFVWFRISK